MSDGWFHFTYRRTAYRACRVLGWGRVPRIEWRGSDGYWNGVNVYAADPELLDRAAKLVFSPSENPGERPASD